VAGQERCPFLVQDGDDHGTLGTYGRGRGAAGGVAGEEWEEAMQG
jgi:hypothetical protein